MRAVMVEPSEDPTCCRYDLGDADRGHRDLEGRATTGKLLVVASP